VRAPLVQASPILRIMRGEHPVALPLLVAAIVIDVLLLAVILALYGFSDHLAAVAPTLAQLALSAAG
jgi:hypothetical protein